MCESPQSTPQSRFPMPLGRSLMRSFRLYEHASLCFSGRIIRYLGCLLGTGEAEEIASSLLDGGRPGDQGEGLLGGDGGHQGVSGEGGEIVEKGSEAVDWEAVLG